MDETLRYYALNELKHLSVDELRALWELVPTDRQRAYRQAYEREVASADAEGSDAQERQVARELLKRYASAALVPIGQCEQSFGCQRNPAAYPYHRHSHAARLGGAG